MRPISIAVAAALAIAACAPPTTASPSPSATAAPSATRSAIASVTIAVPQEPRNLEPGFSDTDVNRVSRNVLEGLVDRDPAKGGLIPQLATSWQQTDPLTWRFQLRQGVTFQNGKPFNAQAAVFAFDRLMSPTVPKSFTVRPLLPNIKATAVSDYVLDLKTEAPSPILPQLMYFVLFPEPSATGTAVDIRNPVGTGAYKVTSFEVDKVTLDAYDGYWGGKPVVQKATFVWRTESAVRAAMVERNEAQIATELAPPDVTTMSKATVKYVVVNETSMTRQDPTCPALADARIRQAIDMAIDRDAIVKNLAPSGTPASQIITPDVVGYNKSLSVTKYDQAKAKALVQEAASAGVPVLTTTVSLMTSPGLYVGAVEVNEALGQMLGAIGIKTKQMVLDIAGFQAQNNLLPIPPDRCMIINTSHGNSVGDASTTFNLYYSTVGRFKACCSAELDQMIQSGIQLSGEARQTALAGVLQNAVKYPSAPIALFHQRAAYGLNGVQYDPRFDRSVLVRTIK